MDEERKPLEYEFIMDGITTRMQTALEKMSESNRILRSSVRYVCVTAIAAIIIIVLGFVVSNRMWISHVDNIRGSEVSASEKVSQPGP